MEWKSARDPSGDCDLIWLQALVSADSRRGNRRGTLRGIATCWSESSQPRAGWKSARDPSGDCDNLEAPAVHTASVGGNRRGTLRGIATGLNRVSHQEPPFVEIGEGPFGGLRPTTPDGSGKASSTSWKSARDPSGDCDIQAAADGVTSTPLSGNRRGTLRGIATCCRSRVRTRTGPPWKSARDPSGDCDSRLVKPGQFS